MEKGKLLKQMEFYFSDANLRRDKFLSALVRSEEDGMVKLEVLLTFNRVKKFMGLSKDLEAEKLKSKENVEALAAVVAESKLLKLNEAKTSVARVEPYKDSRPEVPAQTVRASGLPAGATLEDLEAFFKSLTEEGEVAYVQMMRRKAKDPAEKALFRGVVHVEMSSVEAAKRLSSKKEVKYEEADITLQVLEDYRKQKNCLVAVKGLKGKVSVEQIKNAIGEGDPKMWVYYMRGDEEAVVEFPTLDSAKKHLAVLQSNIGDLQSKVVENTHDEMKKSEVKVEAVLVEGEELTKYVELVKKRRSNKKRKGPLKESKETKKMKESDETDKAKAEDEKAGKEETESTPKEAKEEATA